MEKIDARFTALLLPEALLVESILGARRPLPEDWEHIQGGMSEVVLVEPGLFKVIHRYFNRKDCSGT
ncbi:MAG TPA: hypothetical protein VFD45_02660 [Patescibacteria group bacterium]|nr:hypothetical protein [Patescibacteria group bacterium]